VERVRVRTIMTKAEQDAYERGRWEAVKEAAVHLRLHHHEHAANIVLAHEAQLKKEREVRPHDNRVCPCADCTAFRCREREAARG
jgi:hypothetical protein